MNRFTLSVLCVAAMLMTGGIASADGLMRDGLGAVSGGRGGTNIGHFDNGAILHDSGVQFVVFSRSATRSTSRFAVRIPEGDFFWNACKT
jgi:hypothetical protein